MPNNFCTTSKKIRACLANLVISMVLLTNITACQALPISSTPENNVGNNKAPTNTLSPTKSTPVPILSIPPVWNYITDTFEDGNLGNWGQVSENDLSLAPGEGHNGTTGLSVIVNKGEAYLYRTDMMKTAEGYITFWFNPNNVTIPNSPYASIPQESIRIADIKGTQNYDVIAALRIWKPPETGQTYKAYLEWQDSDGSHFDINAGQFDLADDWQKITLGFRINKWVAVWVNDVLVGQITGVKHSEPFGEIIELGKTNNDTIITPGGVIRYDDVAFQIPRASDLWVDAKTGSDDNTGLTSSNAFLTIQKAADLAGPGTTIHILPGIYRETIRPAANGTVNEPIIYKAEAGPSTTIIRGSENSQSITWHQLKTNNVGLPPSVDPAQIYYADLSRWKLDEAPRFVVQLDDQGNVISRLPLAREPDWPVKTDWKVHEFWWSADGGSRKAACDPATDANPNCDLASRSLTMLTDKTNDADPLGIEPGNLSTLGNLTGATLVALDSIQGHYVYRRAIIASKPSSGQITVDRNCAYDDNSKIPALGWGTKYYVEGAPSLLDTPGEWWYDKSSGLLYLMPPSPTNPSNLNIEIARQENGFNISGRSNIKIDGLTLEYFNGNAIYGYNSTDERSFNNTIENVTLQYSNYGLSLFQKVGQNPENITSHFTLEGSEIAHIDSDALDLSYAWIDESAAASFSVAGITDTVIRNNQLHDLGFRSDQDNANGISFAHADRLIFDGNRVYDVAHNGVQFSWSVIQSQKEYGFSPDEIKTGNILVKDNIFEQACQMTTDCGGLKFWGDPPGGHVYRDVLITGNIFRNNFGWSSVAEKRKLWSGGLQSQVHGMGGFGLYLDMASGFHVYRNIAYNNTFAGMAIGGVWRDGDIIIYNNVAANSLHGFFFSGLEFDEHGNVNTQVTNNIIVNNEADGIWLTDNGKFESNIIIDHNLYSNNGWRSNQDGGVSQPGALLIRRGQDEYKTYPTLADIQSKTAWDSHSLEGEAGFVQYNLNEHDIRVGTWPNFNISANSQNVIDRGAESLPASLTKLLNEFAIQDERIGAAYDIGRYEFGSSYHGQTFMTLADRCGLMEIKKEHQCAACV